MVTSNHIHLLVVDGGERDTIPRSIEALEKSKVVRESKWTQSIAVGDKSFLDQIKDRLGIRARGRKIHGSEDEYQLREGQTVYGAWQDLADENTFDWNLAS